MQAVLNSLVPVPIRRGIGSFGENTVRKSVQERSKWEEVKDFSQAKTAKKNISGRGEV